ncbi:hypothetical protein MTR_3g102320 [Medicago truncatula]|uniref:Uncharacterized protein n=1 Tax=Medicago truncatula TaxID=3880 RepID=G7J700_MEDTR|nr:hypothetical protein MTR_3g102320 [Medicago truncatula]
MLTVRPTPIVESLHNDGQAACLIEWSGNNGKVFVIMMNKQHNELCATTTMVQVMQNFELRCSVQLTCVIVLTFNVDDPPPHFMTHQI